MERPFRYRDTDWLIFPNTLAKDISIDRCGNSVNGICNKYPTIDECITECKNNDCNFGYYISYPEKSCLAVSKEIVNDDYNPSLGWTSLENSRYRPEIKDAKIYSFLNSRKLLFPDTFSNTVYYGDNVFLRTRNIYLNNFGKPKFTTDKNSVLKIAFYNTSDPGVKINGDLQSGQSLFSFKLYDKNFYLQKEDDGDEMIFKFTSGEIPIDKLFTAVKSNSEKGEELHISYGQEIYLKYLDGYIYVDKDGIPKFSKSEKSIFVLENRDSIYYCDSKSCKPVPADKIEKGVANPKYNGRDTYKRDDCFSVCNYIDDKPIFPPFSDYIKSGKDAYLNMTQKEIDRQKSIENTPFIKYILLSIMIVFIVYILLILRKIVNRF